MSGFSSQASKEEIGEFLLEAANGGSGDEAAIAAAAAFMATKHVLLLHAGGDSKRVPWANPMGKAFLPLPYLAGDNPDGPVPLLFDHILAISSSARQAFNNQGCSSDKIDRLAHLYIVMSERRDPRFYFHF
jgi:fucokinase